MGRENGWTIPGYTGTVDGSKLWRCGIAGSKSLVANSPEQAITDSEKHGSLQGRFGMYVANWIGGGHCVAFARIVRNVQSTWKINRGEEEFREDRFPIIGDDDQQVRERYGTRVQGIEYRWHALLRRHPEVFQLRSPKGQALEWFYGEPETMLKQLLCLLRQDDSVYLFSHPQDKLHCEYFKVKERASLQYKCKERDPTAKQSRQQYTGPRLR